MKTKAILVLCVGLALEAIGADSIKISDLPSATQAQSADLLLIVTDPATTPTTKKITTSIFRSGYDSTATNIAAYQAKIATNGFASTATNIAAYQAKIATNGIGGIDASTVTNIAAYQAEIATNALGSAAFVATTAFDASGTAAAATNGLNASAFTGQASSVVAGITNTWRVDATNAATQATNDLIITEGKLSLSDTTTADATTNRHGFLAKLSGELTNILRGDGTFGSLVGPITNDTSGTASEAAHSTNADNATWATNIAAAGVAGAVAEASHATNADNATTATNAVNSTNFWGVLNPTNLPAGLATSNYVGTFAGDGTGLSNVPPPINLAWRRQYYEGWDEFIGRILGASAQLSQGPLGLYPHFSGTGTSVSYVAGESNAPGILRLAMGSTESGYSIMSSIVGQTSGGQISPLGTYTNMFRFRIGATNDATTTNNYILIVGLNNLPNTGVIGSADGAYLRYGSNSQFFQFITLASGTATTNTTATIPTPGTWYEAMIVLEATSSATNAYLYLNASPVATNTATIPTRSGNRLVGWGISAIKQDGADNRTVDIDYGYLGWKLETTR